MRRKSSLKIIIGSIGICLLSGLCGCAGENAFIEYAMSVFGSEYDTREQRTQAETEEVRQSPETETELQEAKEQADGEALEEAYRLILEEASEELTGGYPVDRVFLEWVSSEFGGECILEAAKQSQTFSPDSGVWYRMTENSIHVLWLLYCQEMGMRPDLLENVEWKECASADQVTLAFTGDINFSEGYPTTRHLDSCANGIEDCFSADLLDLMRGMDIMMINNEFTYSTRGEPLPGKTYTFRAKPDRAKLLHAFGTDIANLANNHVFDYGPEALLDTIEALDQEGIPHVGAGANIEDASKPYYFVCNGRKIAIVSATQIERSTNYTKEATEDSPGVLKTLNPDRFVQVIEGADKKSDCVIAVVHWGTEGNSSYGQDQVKLAQAFVDAGADAIIGGHTHCLQGVEIMDGVPIIYSLGNFWFSSNTLDTGLAQVTIDRNGDLALSFIPCIQEQFRTRLVTQEAEKERIFAFMQKYSAQGTELTEDGFVREEQQEED